MSAQSLAARIPGFGFASTQADDRDQTVADLQAEVSRLREELSAVNPVAHLPTARGNPSIIRNIIDARHRRSTFLPASLFSDPAWDMLLDLYLAHHSQVRISISGLCIASNVPASTALRWLKVLQDNDLVKRRTDPLDARRHFIDLTSTGVEAMTAYFDTLRVSPAVI